MALSDRTLKVLALFRDKQASLGRDPTSSELAPLLGISRDQVARHLKLAREEMGVLDPHLKDMFLQVSECRKKLAFHTEQIEFHQAEVRKLAQTINRLSTDPLIASSTDGSRTHGSTALPDSRSPKRLR